MHKVIIVIVIMICMHIDIINLLLLSHSPNYTTTVLKDGKEIHVCEYSVNAVCIYNGLLGLLKL